MFNYNKMKFWIRCFVISIIFSYVLLKFRVTSHNSVPRPNIICILADDMGWNDVSYHGSDQISTPNIDALAYHGIILKRHYSQQVCTPSRAAFLTGQYPMRLGFQGYPIEIGQPRFIPKDVNTLPLSLKRLGYHNHMVGKWHLGYAKKEHTPLGYGFDTHFGYWNGYTSYFSHNVGYTLHGSDFHNDYEPILDKYGQYATDLFTERAIEIIENHPETDSLYLVINHLAGHTGLNIGSDDETVLEVHNITATNKKYYYIKDEKRRKYAEIIERMDQSIGEVVGALAKKNMLKNSIIVFFSDNGAPTYGIHSNAGSNYPLRGIKMTMYEGGIRTPSLIYSPLLNSAESVFNELFHITDWVPTLYNAAGGDVKDLGTIDGISQWYHMANKYVSSKRSELFVDIDPKFNYGAIIGFGGRYKLVNNSYFSFNHSGDPGFTNSTAHFERVKLSKTNLILEKLSNRRLTLPETIQRRADLLVKCKKVAEKDVKPCNGMCLFNLEEDPCEYDDIANEHPDIVEYLWHRLETLKNQAKLKADIKTDPRSDPKYCNNTWFNWLDDDGCWFRNNNKENRQESFVQRYSHL